MNLINAKQFISNWTWDIIVKPQHPSKRITIKIMLISILYTQKQNFAMNLISRLH